MRILIVKLAALGDVIMASTMIKALRSKYPDCHLTWLCGKETEALVKCFKGIDEILVIDNKGLAGSIKDKVATVLNSWRLFKHKNYDLILTAHSDSQYRFLTLPLRGEKRGLYDQDFKIKPLRYHGVEYARLALGEKAYLNAEFPFADYSFSGYDGYVPDVLMLPGGAKNLMDTSSLKRWPVEFYVILAKAIIEEGFSVGIIGSKSDEWVLPYFDNVTVTSFIGKTDIPVLLNIIKSSKVLISNDSGPMHMGFLTGTLTIGIFGPVHPKMVVPKKLLNNMIVKDYSCTPCYDGRFYADCPSNECMKTISVREVLDKVNKCLIVENKL